MVAKATVRRCAHLCYWAGESDCLVGQKLLNFAEACGRALGPPMHARDPGCYRLSRLKQLW